MNWLIDEVFAQAAWIGDTLAAADPESVGIVFRDETRKPRARMQAGLQRAEREFASLPPDAAAEIRKLQGIVNGAVGTISFLDGAKYYAGTDIAKCGERGWSAVLRHIKGVPFPAAEAHKFPVNPGLKALTAPLSETLAAVLRQSPPAGQPPMPERSEGNAGAAVVEPEDDADREIEKLESETPPLDRASGKWVNNKRAAEIEGVETRTLADYRVQGIRNAEGTLGRDKEGRLWRREGTPHSHPWYLRSTLRAK